MKTAKKSNARLIGVVVFIVLVVPIALFIDKNESPTPIKQHYERRTISYSNSVSTYRPYTETELRKLVKDYSTHESVIYNASKLFLKYPSESSKQGLVKHIEKRKYKLSQERMLACFTLAVTDSGKSGERFLQAFRDVYGR